MSDGDNDNQVKALLSRVPLALAQDNDKFLSFLKDHLEGVEEVSAVLDEDGKEEQIRKIDDDHDKLIVNENFEKKKSRDANSKRTFAFVTFKDKESTRKAIDVGTLKYKDGNSKKSHVLYIRPKVENLGAQNFNDPNNVCFLWKAGRCTHGDNCKFAHDGEGSCVERVEGGGQKKQKCFAFKKKGKCRAGDACPYSHEVVFIESNKVTSASKEDVDKSEKDCINWKVKGKCRKGDSCPYKHDPEVREKALAKKAQGDPITTEDVKSRKDIKDKKDKVRQPLSVRVFGLCYDTTESDVREYFGSCGKIVEVMFPIFEDSGRSKGYCGILFQSPKAVEKALELNESELHGRWLSVQAGKMYLKQWEENTERQIEISEMKRKGSDPEKEEAPIVGEFGQRVKRRKKHGYEEGGKSNQ